MNTFFRDRKYLGLSFFCFVMLPGTAIPQACTNIGGLNPSTITENFDNLGISPTPRSDQSNNLTNLSLLPPVNPPASRFLGRFDNTFSDAGTIVNVPWAEIEEGPTSTIVSGRYNVGDGTTTGANTYSFGSLALPNDRALGSLTNTGADRNLLGTCFTNTTGANILTVYINYTGEQWRNGGSNVPNRLDFQYAVDTTPAPTDNIFTANGGTFTDFNSLDFVSPVTSSTAAALNGNVAPNRTVFLPTAMPVLIPPGSVLYIRWVDTKTVAGNADDSLALDDFRISLIAPTAANVTISGRVTTSDGSGISRSTVSLRDAAGHTRNVTTSTFGYYQFTNVEAGGTYIVSVANRLYLFPDSPRVINVEDSIVDANFQASP